MTKRFGFTLSEVLITLGIIGVVAAMTIPTLVVDYQSRSFNTAASVFERKLGEVLKVMNSQSTLAGFDTTEDFVQELSKHLKITKVCKNNELVNCFEKEVSWGSSITTSETVNINKIKTAKHFGQIDWPQTNVIGVQFANGVSALIAYNKDAKQDPVSNQIVKISGNSNSKSGSVNLGTDALAILYDTNGAKSPNQSSKDLRSINITQLGSGCFAEINDICLTGAPFNPTPITKTECENLKLTHGIKECSSNYDYWAGAVKECGGVSKMASMAELGEIAAYVYNKDSIGTNEDLSSLTLNPTKAAELGIFSSSLSLWSNEESTIGYAYIRNFYSTLTDYSVSSRSNGNLLVVCLNN